MQGAIKTYDPKLKNFPIMMYAIVMGLSGLSLVYLKAYEVFGFSKLLALTFVWIDVIVFVVISGFYIAKIFKHFEDVKAEFAHPVRVNFFATFSISLLLLSAIFNALHVSIGVYFWYIGTILQAFMTFYCLSFWINKNIQINHSSPAWLIPVVGNVIVPLGGVEFVSADVLYYFFTIGMFFWVILLSILLNRMIFHNQMPQKFLPTMFILIAPPSVGMVSYLNITHSFDMVALGLYNIALFFSLLLLFMLKNFLKLQFFISWWAFTFPVAAMSVASMVAYLNTQKVFYEIFSYLSIISTSVVIIIVTIATIKSIFKNEICVAE